MAKLLLGLMACIAAFVMAEALTCRQCSLQLFGLCLSGSTETCPVNETVCATTKLTFPALSSFSGFTSLGCATTTGCNKTMNSTVLQVTLTTTLTCCSTDKCNNAATSTKMTMTGVISAAMLAVVWGGMSL